MKEKRMGPDVILKIISGIIIASWLILAVIFILLALGNPTSPGFQLSRPGVKGIGTWTSGLIYTLLIFLFLLSVSAIFFNIFRLKRKTDHMKLTPIFSAILAMGGLLIFIFAR
jgi:hypothetical protein